jgi:predicted nuclease of predicted toxin-antitoxin system
VARFLIDESLPRAVGRALAAQGHDVLDARDAGLRGAPDEAVFDRAVAERRVIVAGDLDFANTLRFRPGSHAGIVVLRLPSDWGPSARATRAASAVTEVLAFLDAGALVIADPSRVRILAAR